MSNIRRGIKGAAYAILVFAAAALTCIVVIALFMFFIVWRLPNYTVTTWWWVGFISLAVAVIATCLEILDISKVTKTTK